MSKGLPFLSLTSERASGYGIPANLRYNALTVGMVGFLVLAANLTTLSLTNAVEVFQCQAEWQGGRLIFLEHQNC